MTNVVETLDWLIAYWPDLLDARLPMATPRPWQQSEVSPEVRAERDAIARQERFERSNLSFGESPAPVDVSVLQAALDVLVRADDLAAELTEWSVCPPPAPPALGQLDARPYLYAIRAALLAEHHDYNGEPGPWAALAEPTLTRMYEAVARCLAMLYTGQTVRVICPWCHGVDTEHPAGGAWTWRVVELPGQQVAIVCMGVCEPPLRDVGTWWGGQPCWPLADWQQLARHSVQQTAQSD
ncbi:hypothetical protein ACIBHY_17040 [Nonomuraea sp. NPDC050547]|uniref:hypothetical protein n=1 Tax=Nonomuraea sp. NPDC050547 TaxID=3364368 RepID=UPI0037B8722D